MIMPRIRLTEDNLASVDDLLERLRKHVDQQIVELEKKRDPGDRQREEKIANLYWKLKYLSRPNLLLILVLRGIEDMRQSYATNDDDEETIDQMTHYGIAKGKPDAKRDR